jgi:hypothetical protein
VTTNLILPESNVKAAAQRIADAIKFKGVRVFERDAHMISCCQMGWDVIDRIERNGYVEIAARYTHGGYPEIIDLRDLLVEDGGEA